MDHSATAPAPSVLPLRLKNFGASAAIVVIAAAVYGLAPYNQRQLDTLYGSSRFSFTGAQFLVAAALTYIALLGAYFIGLREPVPSKSLRFLRIAAAALRSPAMLRRRGLVRD